ncbi:hypothetical protein E1263_11875 [Kribbella antibiotica]|uniref:Fibronectin type III domain-containing protein n=1 Tax=Kribbella antibiotica TaxID=190195 RepID=A0A4R4ZQX6_9ACTN|nr:hypothetical protein [Kribbella antibiotica]TDD60309.1 hypothetical protein E1263_11875 [Kribbella antibiotica]
MRKLALAATAVAALSVGLQTPAFAAAPDAPTDVTIAWADSQNVKLTWADDGLANAIYWQLPGGDEVKYVDVSSTHANEILVPASALAPSKDHVKLIVKAVNPDGESPSAPSPEFDTLVPAAPALQDANLAANLSTHLTWTQAATTDGTPGDPLDNAAYEGVEISALRYDGTSDALGRWDSSTTSATIASQPRPTTLTLSSFSPWGNAKGARTVKLGTLTAGMSVPASALYANRLAIKSWLFIHSTGSIVERASGIPVELQARAKSTDAWKTWGRYSGNTTAAFDTGIASLGNRQYRLWVPARKVVSSSIIFLTPATSTGAKSSKTLVKIVSGGFNPAVARPGVRWTLSLKIAPAVSVRATVQYWNWNKKIWVNDGWVQLTKGSWSVRSAPDFELGTYRVRFVVPTVVVNGLTVNANTSPGYNQTIR